MSRPTNIDSEAIRILEKANWPWSDATYAFVKSRDPERETTEDYRSRSPGRINYGELHDHHLLGPASTAELEDGLQWLRERLSISS